MKAREIYTQIIEKHSNVITSAEIEEFETEKYIQASINFENKSTISIVQNTDKFAFENYVKVFGTDGAEAYCKTTDNFKIEDIIELVK